MPQVLSPQHLGECLLWLLSKSIKAKGPLSFISTGLPSPKEQAVAAPWLVGPTEASALLVSGLLVAFLVQSPCCSEALLSFFTLLLGRGKMEQKGPHGRGNKAPGLAYLASAQPLGLNPAGLFCG